MVIDIRVVWYRLRTCVIIALKKKLNVMCIPDLVIGGVALLNGLLLNASPTTFCEK